MKKINDEILSGELMILVVLSKLISHDFYGKITEDITPYSYDSIYTLLKEYADNTAIDELMKRAHKHNLVELDDRSGGIPLSIRITSEGIRLCKSIEEI